MLSWYSCSAKRSSKSEGDGMEGNLPAVNINTNIASVESGRRAVWVLRCLAQS